MQGYSARRTNRARSLLVVLLTLAAAAPVFVSHAAFAQKQSQPSNTARQRKTFNLVPAKEAVVPFHAGETFAYRLEWSAFSNAASVELSIPERRDLFGWQTWHFRAVAHTQSPVRNLFVVDDQFDSYTDAYTLESRQYEAHLHEMGRTDDEVLHFAPTGQKSHAPPPLVAVIPGTRDPLGFVYALRAADWNAPEIHANVYDGRDLYEVFAKREGVETVKVAAGSYACSRFGLQLLRSGKEVPGIHFTVWMANDEAKTPVALQAQLPFGNVRAELISVK
jgi:hypothetical protein